MVIPLPCPLSTLPFWSPLPILLVVQGLLLQEGPLNPSCPDHSLSPQTLLLTWAGMKTTLLEWSDVPVLNIQ